MRFTTSPVRRTSDSSTFSVPADPALPVTISSLYLARSRWEGVAPNTMLARQPSRAAACTSCVSDRSALSDGSMRASMAGSGVAARSRLIPNHASITSLACGFLRTMTPRSQWSEGSFTYDATASSARVSVPSIRSTIAATLGHRRTECFGRFPKRRTLLTRWIKTKRRGSLGHRGPSLRRREIAQRGIELTHASHANEPIPIHNSLPNPEVRTRDRTRPLSWRQFLREYERGYYQEHSEQRCFNWSTHGAAPRYFGVAGSAHDPHGCAFACALCTADLNRDGRIGGKNCRRSWVRGGRLRGQCLRTGCSKWVSHA